MGTLERERERERAKVKIEIVRNSAVGTQFNLKKNKPCDGTKRHTENNKVCIPMELIYHHRREREREKCQTSDLLIDLNDSEFKLWIIFFRYNRSYLLTTSMAF